MNIINIPSPHHTSGRKKYLPQAIVIHIMEGSLSGTDSWFRDPRSKVSAHYGIGKSGAVHQYVLETNTAWHAGRVNAPTWQLIKKTGNGLFINPNFYTIGIEHEGSEDSDWTEAMYQASAALIKDICSRWNIPLDRNHIIGHHEIYSLKTCPGHKVNLNKLILMAGGGHLPGSPDGEIIPSRIQQPGIATTRTRMHIRPRPSTELAQLDTVERNVTLSYAGYTNEGEIINGNGKWYYTNEGNWFWSGAVVPAEEIIPAKDTAGLESSLTVELIRAATGAKLIHAQKLAPYIEDTCNKYEINTAVRRLCFLSQVGHESGGLFYTEELASGHDYEGREDLGNTFKGDGIKYKGRGLIQITGRFNYAALSKDLNADFISDPSQLGGKSVNHCSDDQLRFAAMSAGWFWDKKGLNATADNIDLKQEVDEGENLRLYKQVTKIINGGYNGLQDRLQKFERGIAFFSKNTGPLVDTLPA